jgi:long-subunit fatty acid transport protein
MSKIFAFSLILLVLVVPAFAQENLGARPMGMGGAFTGLADDVNAIFINPAGIGSLQRESAMVSSRVSQGREYTMIGGVQTTPYGNLGVGYVGSTDPIEGTVELPSWDGENAVKYTTQTLYLTLARELNQAMNIPRNMGALSLGMNLKFSSRKLGTANGLSQGVGSSLDVDLASVFKPNENISLGLSLQNFLSADKSQIANLDTVEQKNYTVLAGISGKLFDGRLILTAENEELGCEIQPIKGFTLRAGRGKDSITSGIGININGFGIDYAYLQKESPVHYWSISIIPNDAPAVKTASLNIE